MKRGKQRLGVAAKVMTRSTRSTASMKAATLCCSGAARSCNRLAVRARDPEYRAGEDSG
jgi:hypothetical protein